MPTRLNHLSALKLLVTLLLITAVSCGGGNTPVNVEADSWPPPDSPFEEGELSSTDLNEMDEIAALRPQATTRIEQQLLEMRETAHLQENDPQRSLLTAMGHADEGEFEQAIAEAEHALELAKEKGDEELSSRIACHLKRYRRSLKRS